MSTAEIAFVEKVREQIKFLRDKEYNYDQLLVYLSGIAQPWVFGRAHEFAFEGNEVLIARLGPAEEHENVGVPEYVFPLRHVVATELSISEG